MSKATNQRLFRIKNHWPRIAVPDKFHRIVGLLLSSINRDDLTCYPSTATIANKACCHLSTVKRNLRAIRQLGLFKIENLGAKEARLRFGARVKTTPRHRYNVYHVNLDHPLWDGEGIEEAMQVIREKTYQGVATRSMKGVGPDHLQGGRKGSGPILSKRIGTDLETQKGKQPSSKSSKVCPPFTSSPNCVDNEVPRPNRSSAAASGQDTEDACGSGAGHFVSNKKEDDENQSPRLVDFSSVSSLEDLLRDCCRRLSVEEGKISFYQSASNLRRILEGLPEPEGGELLVGDLLCAMNSDQWDGLAKAIGLWLSPRYCDRFKRELLVALELRKLRAKREWEKSPPGRFRRLLDVPGRLDLEFHGEGNPPSDQYDLLSWLIWHRLPHRRSNFRQDEDDEFCFRCVAPRGFLSEKESEQLFLEWRDAVAETL